MNYLEYKITAITPEQADIVVAYLADWGFESFGEWNPDNGGSIDCYILEQDAEQDEIKNFLTLEGYQFQLNTIVQQNWNAIWESNFEPIEIDDRLYIRAIFHPERQGVDHQIVITPKMSFGTGHHPTTHLVAQAMLEQDFATLTGLDMGSGTGILAILAAQRGAIEVDAIDIDEWAYENCVENIQINGVTSVVCPILGDAKAIGKRYDFVLANINRNILLADMALYIESLRAGGGFLIMSGILEMDLDAITAKAQELGMVIDTIYRRQGWAAIKAIKP